MKNKYGDLVCIDFAVNDKVVWRNLYKIAGRRIFQTRCGDRICVFDVVSDDCGKVPLPSSYPLLQSIFTVTVCVILEAYF